MLTYRESLVAVLLGVHLLSPPESAWAAIDDYEFRLLQDTVKHGEEVSISVQVVEKRTGKPVPDAVVFASRLDMAPDGMATMTASLEPERDTEPGIYKFKTNLVMKGSWQLLLAAKLQGEVGTLQSKFLLKATD